MKNPKRSACAVFLDRDGVINEDTGYVHKVDELRLIPHAAAAIALLHLHGFLVIVVTNQAGIAYGYYKESDMRAFNEALQGELLKEGARIDAFYFCPHHATKGVGAYRVNCDCRKPKAGLFLKAALDFDIDLSRSYMVGDTWNDIAAGKKAGCTTIMVRTGNGAKELLHPPAGGKADYIARTLYEAVAYIRSKSG